MLNESVVGELDWEKTPVTQTTWVERALSVLYYNVGSWMPNEHLWDVLDHLVSIQPLNERVYLLRDTISTVKELPCVSTEECFKIDTCTD